MALGITHPDIEMRSQTGRQLESATYTRQCKDFLCSQESKLKEWFPTLLKGRLRVKALDPYCFMKPISSKGTIKSKDLTFIYACSIETCHAKISLRYVKPDPKGNEIGLHGCFEHQHKLETMKERRCEIIFENRKDAQECFHQNGFKVMYKNMGHQPKQPMTEKYICRRQVLKKGLGYHPCKSSLRISESFKEVTSCLKLEPGEEVPFSLSGTFYHPHMNDKRFHKKRHGGFTRNHDDPSLDRQKRNEAIRIKNGQIFPVYARKYVTMEEVLAARVGKGRSGKKKGKTISEPTTIATYMINIEERMKAENDVLEHQNSKNTKAVLSSFQLEEHETKT